jgi:hypothetical protein
MDESYLPLESIIKNMVNCGSGYRIIFPDGNCSYRLLERANFPALGHKYFSKYLGEMVEIVELSEDGTIAWVESCRKLREHND